MCRTLKKTTVSLPLLHQTGDLILPLNGFIVKGETIPRMDRPLSTVSLDHNSSQTRPLKSVTNPRKTIEGEKEGKTTGRQGHSPDTTTISEGKGGRRKPGRLGQTYVDGPVRRILWGRATVRERVSERYRGARDVRLGSVTGEVEKGSVWYV